MTLTQESILEAFERNKDPNMRIKHLGRVLEVHTNQRRHLRELLDRLVRSGALEKLRGGRFKRASAKNPQTVSTSHPRARADQERKQKSESPSARNQVVGKFIAHRDGYGFVEVEKLSPASPSKKTQSPSRPGITASQRQQISGDIFIPPLRMRGALHGDRVVVEVDAIKGDRRAEGHVVRVLERKFDTVVGRFKKHGSAAVVIPFDEKFLHQVVIERSEEGSAKEGDIVDVAITRFPTPLESPRGRVVEILGRPGDFGIDVEIIIRKHHLPHRFPEEVKAAALEVPDQVSAGEIARREDFRSLPIVTIDGETAKDFDDAVYVKRLRNGNYELQVHIADVAHYVTPGSPLDVEAALRGTSVYFPDRAVPMLPEELSNGICSLKPKVDRLVQSCLMEINSNGEVVAHRFAQGVIRSVERMTYTNVAKILVDQDRATRERYASLVDEFRRMEELAHLLNRMRDRRGSIDFDLPEPIITFDENGVMTGVVRSERNIAHRLIEEFMLIANETVARELFERAAPTLYRVHEPPDPTKVATFEMLARSFGYSLGIELVVKKLAFEKESREKERRGGRRDTEARSQRPEARRGRPTGFSGSNVWLQPTDLVVSPKDYQRLVEKLEGKPEERILSYLMLRSLKQARYSEQNLGHFGLASSCYTHFTSPIRRYPDLIVHRILGSLREIHAKPGSGSTARVHRAHALPGSPRYTNAQLAVMGAESSESERRADNAERELVDWKKAKFMQGHVGDDFDGLIVGVNKNGLYVELLEWFIEGFVSVSSLFDDYYVYRESLQSLVGERTRKKFRIGDRVRVMVDRIDEQSHKVQFLIEGLEPGSLRQHRRRKGVRSIA